MSVPFTTKEFMRVLVQYNHGVWPLQLVLAGLALAALALAWSRRSRAVAGILGLLWIWMGVAYHWIFFTSINRAAWGFGALFVIQGLLLLHEGVLKDRLTFDLGSGRLRWLSAGLLAYALVIYPVLGHLLGHRYPASPTFGLPCPTTIFTFGLLLVAEGRTLKRLLVVPFLWSVIGFGAAVSFGIHEDVGLLVAGVTATLVIVVRDLRGRSRVQKRG